MGILSIKKTPQPPPAPTALGFEIAAFAADTLVPAEEAEVEISALWTSYRAWCAKSAKVPLAYAVFLEDFAEVAQAVGMKSRQHGGHLIYTGVAFA